MSRFDPSTVISVSMTSSHNTTLIVTVDSISLSGPSQAVWKPNGTAGASFNIDSTLAQIWLPVEACKIFEQTFGLTWNDSAQLYLLNDATHSRLLQSNPTVNFTIRGSDDRTVDYTLPYTAFNLKITAPVVNPGSFHYFP